MKTRFCFSLCRFALAMAGVLPLRAEEPIIPPSISKIWPAGMERGSTATFTVDGRNLSGCQGSDLRCARHQRRVDRRSLTCPRRLRDPAQARILERRCRSAKSRPPSWKSRWRKMSRPASIVSAFGRRSAQPTWLSSTIGALPEVAATSQDAGLSVRATGGIAGDLRRDDCLAGRHRQLPV